MTASEIPHERDAHPKLWAMEMTWSNLAFLHWRVDVEAVARTLPEGLAVDTYDGAAFVGVVPFQMDLKPRALSMAALSFHEMNVRTYVTCRGTPGVWFYSLDADSKLAVRGARAGFHLPYFDARFAVSALNGVTRYTCDGHAHIDVTYRGGGPTFRAQPGSLEDWLTARFTLYAAGDDGRVFRGDIHHEPWPLQEADVDLRAVSVPEFRLEGAPIAHVASSPLDVVGWWRRRVWPVHVGGVR